MLCFEINYDTSYCKKYKHFYFTGAVTAGTGGSTAVDPVEVPQDDTDDDEMGDTPLQAQSTSAEKQKPSIPLNRKNENLKKLKIQTSSLQWNSNALYF